MAANYPKQDSNADGMNRKYQWRRGEEWTEKAMCFRKTQRMNVLWSSGGRLWRWSGTMRAGALGTRAVADQPLWKKMLKLCVQVSAFLADWFLRRWFLKIDSIFLSRNSILHCCPTLLPGVNFEFTLLEDACTKVSAFLANQFFRRKF